MPYKVYNHAMATSPDGGGVIVFGGIAWLPNEPYAVTEDRILELRYGSDKWNILSQKLKHPRWNPAVIPFSYLGNTM